MFNELRGENEEPNQLNKAEVQYVIRKSWSMNLLTKDHYKDKALQPYKLLGR